MSDNLYGLLAEFKTPEALVNAARAATAQGYTRMDAYTPFPIEELSEALKHKRSRLPLIFLLGGILGGAGGYFMEWYSMAVYYPINVGGRPLHSWPSFIPVTFELTILFAALCGVLGLFLLMKLPRPHHPLFGIEDFPGGHDKSNPQQPT